MHEAIRGVNLSEFGPAPQKGIVLATGYESVHSKAWIVPKKKPELRRDRVVKGPCKLRGPKGTRYFDSTEEMLKAMWEDTDKQLQPYRYPDQESFKNVEKQTGKAMSSRELIKRVLKLNPDLFVEDSWGAPGCAGFYIMIDGQKKWTGASFRRGIVPEFTIMGTDAADLVTTFRWGWRRVLVRLLKGSYLTWPQINRVWGDVHLNDERAKHWALNVKHYRT